MAERTPLHPDESVDPDVARALRRHGIEVTTTVEAGLRTQRDEAQSACARREHRVLVTHDETDRKAPSMTGVRFPLGAFPPASPRG